MNGVAALESYTDVLINIYIGKYINIRNVPCH